MLDFCTGNFGSFVQCSLPKDEIIRKQDQAPAADGTNDILSELKADLSMHSALALTMLEADSC